VSSSDYDPALWEHARVKMIEALDAACREQAAGTGRFAGQQLPPGADILAEVQAAYSLILTSESPRPRLLEVGSFVRFRHALARQQGRSIHDLGAESDHRGPLKLYDVPIVETDQLGPDGWRLLDGDGRVLKEGTL
jgi:hypothetical protein